jgi:hypothetical protein
MDRDTLIEYLNQKILALREEYHQHDSAMAELSDRIEKLEDLRDDPDTVDALTDIASAAERHNFLTPAPDLSAVTGIRPEMLGDGIVTMSDVLILKPEPKSRQYKRVKRFFDRNNNEWASAAEISAGSGVVTHSVRQMMYQRYTDLFERRSLDGATQFRFKPALLGTAHDD